MHKLKGDTLVEVAIAIGIFSMVAITVVSVTTASTNSAQASLEVTLTREEIDAQADALRFIHDSYAAGTQSEESGKNKYKALWEAIVARTVDSTVAPIRNYNTVASCASLYNSSGEKLKTSTDNTLKGTKPFIINTRQLSSTDASKVVIANSAQFKPAITFPRIYYGGNDSLFAQAETGGNTITSVEGLFIIGFKGTNTVIVDGTNVYKQAGTYYDFYIRSCWMPPGATRASTISTVVRLSDPAAIDHKDH